MISLLHLNSNMKNLGEKLHSLQFLVGLKKNTRADPMDEIYFAGKSAHDKDTSLEVGTPISICDVFMDN